MITSQFEDFVDDRAVLALQFTCFGRWRSDIRPLFYIYFQASVRAGLSRAGYTSIESENRNRRSTAGKMNAFSNFRHNANLCVSVPTARHQKDALVVTRI